MDCYRFLDACFDRWDTIRRCIEASKGSKSLPKNRADIALFHEEMQLRTGLMFEVDPKPNTSNLTQSPHNV